MTHQFPLTLPAPTAFSWRGRRPSLVSRVQMSSGIVRQTRLQRFSRYVYNVSWVFTNAELKLYEGFVFGGNTNNNPGIGGQWFEYQVCAPFMQEKKRHVCRFVDQAQDIRPNGHLKGVYTNTVTNAIEFSTIPSTDYVEPAGNAVVPGTITDI